MWGRTTWNLSNGTCIKKFLDIQFGRMSGWIAAWANSTAASAAAACSRKVSPWMVVVNDLPQQRLYVARLCILCARNSGRGRAKRRSGVRHCYFATYFNRQDISGGGEKTREDGQVRVVWSGLDAWQGERLKMKDTSCGCRCWAVVRD